MLPRAPAPAPPHPAAVVPGGRSPLCPRPGHAL